MALPLNRVKSSTIIAFTIIFLTIFTGNSLAGGLRPSDHGLQYQFTSPPTESHSPPGKMKSFFGNSASSPPPPSKSELLPKATATDVDDDDSWWRDVAGNRRDHVMRHVFLAASIVCGVSGVVILLVFSFIYFFKYRKHHQLSNDSK